MLLLAVVGIGAAGRAGFHLRAESSAVRERQAFDEADRAALELVRRAQSRTVSSPDPTASKWTRPLPRRRSRFWRRCSRPPAGTATQMGRSSPPLRVHLVSIGPSASHPFPPFHRPTATAARIQSNRRPPRRTSLQIPALRPRHGRSATGTGHRSYRPIAPRSSRRAAPRSRTTPTTSAFPYRTIS